MADNINLNVKSKRCTGCLLCQSICNQNAIDILIDEEGFLYPGINKNCINCGKCASLCPVSNKVDSNKNPKIYAMRVNDNAILRESASGGIFSALAYQFLSEGNYICSARWDVNYTKVYHDLTKEIKEMKYFISSKYVQSSMQEVFEKIMDIMLVTNDSILFCGTPCQVAAVKTWSGKMQFDSRIYACDILCFGVPSPEIYNQYRKYMIEKYNSPITKFNFRSKKNGWCNYSIDIDFENGMNYTAGKFDDPFYRGFINQYFSRMCCYNCQFAGIPRCGDITLGDYWGAKKGYYNFYGVSVVSTNTEKGKILIDNLTSKRKVKSSVITFDMVAPYNKRFSEGKSVIPEVRSIIYQELKAKGFEDIRKKYLLPENPDIKRAFVEMHLRKKDTEVQF